MYTRFYRLGGRPFEIVPDQRFFFASRAHRRALARLAVGLEQAEGFIVVVGETGSGKTTSMDVLGAQLRGTPLRMVRLDRAPDDPDQVLASVAAVLGLDAPSPAAGWNAVEMRLRAFARTGRRVLLVVDDADDWSIAALEMLCRLSDLRSDGRALMQIILLGQPHLARRSRSPGLEHLRERVVMAHRLGRLGIDEVANYVTHRLARAGWNGNPVFRPEAIRGIGAYAGGLPGRINLLCARLLIEGAIRQRHVIDGAAVAQAIDQGAQADRSGAAPPRSMAAAHDLKSLAGLLSMTVANARRHRADPVFIDDLLVTLDGAVAKLDRIVAMLRDEHRAAQRIDLAVRLRRLVSERRSAGSVVRLRLDGHGDAVVEADPEGLDAALGHLIDNALEAAGSAEITLDRRGCAVAIEVRDHGPGMAPRFVRDSLLAPFVSTKPDGQGLGAHQAKRFVDACGGRLEVYSSPGGTTIRLILPLSERPPVHSAI